MKQTPATTNLRFSLLAAQPHSGSISLLVREKFNAPLPYGKRIEVINYDILVSYEYNPNSDNTIILLISGVKIAQAGLLGVRSADKIHNYIC